jgi:hypothetical protein
LFNNNNEDSIDDTKYCVSLARGSGGPDKPNTDDMSEDKAVEALSKWEKDWKKAHDRDRRKSAREEVDDTIAYTGFCLICLEP